ncbi:MAG: F0F1 ATP synthase subunit A [Actinomycetota bacterium]|nr:F0F1 ATP synthase subunit A [Acidimicrobiales bacterium]MEC8921913.1 F0F1 ATP synthase subunit A [Actinomycetota bacterium]MED5551917.1 F0F1 ATP synthase subunit A [Actinomycetota bacterium]MEE3186854.1 F0F1 ATP synthase subunit A [Actinomycetota bacterium]
MIQPLYGLHFPPIAELLEWPGILFDGSIIELNKVGLIYLWAMAAPLVLFVLAIRRSALVPKGVQTVAESSVDFVRENVVMQTIGPDGMRFMPFLMSLFFFIFFANITEVIPFIQFPANSRMAAPAVLAIIVWLVFNAVGIKSQGFFQYFKNTVIPPGVPGALLPLVAVIEFVSTFLVRPFSLAVRLFANMLAGHLLLVTFAVLTTALWTPGPLAAIVWAPFVVLIGLTGFEILVAFLQAFIFTILTAVYIGGALHPEH